MLTIGEFRQLNAIKQRQISVMQKITSLIKTMENIAYTVKIGLSSDCGNDMY